MYLSIFDIAFNRCLGTSKFLIIIQYLNDGAHAADQECKDYQLFDLQYESYGFFNFFNYFRRFSCNFIPDFDRSIFILLAFKCYLIIIDYHSGDMGGKKWCEYCRINIDYSKKAIQDHEATRMHIQNKQKHIKFERMKIQKQKKQQKEKLYDEHGPLLGTANIPKAKRGSDLQKQVQEYRNQIMQEGKSAIHRLIAERTKGLYGAPIQFPEKEDLNLIENYDVQKKEGKDQENSQTEFKVWSIQICQETQKPCFVNGITKGKLYNPPVGYILSERQKKQWQEAQEYAQYLQTIKNKQGEEAVMPIWEQCQEQDYFQANAGQNSEDLQSGNLNQSSQAKIQHDKLNIQYGKKLQQPKQQQPQHNWRAQLQQKINNQAIDGDQVLETVIYHKLNQCKNVKQKNEVLKRLIKNDFQIKTSFNQKSSLLENQDEKEAVGFKPRKRVKKNVELVDQKDLF